MIREPSFVIVVVSAAGSFRRQKRVEYADAALRPGWMTLRAKPQLLCVGLDFVDRVVFDRGEVLDDEGQGVVDSFSDGVDTGSIGEQIEPWPFGAPVCRFDEALGFEFPHDPHLVVNDVWCQCIWTNYGAFANHDHVFFSYQAWMLGSEI
jgi:hypothetical protein